MLNLLDIEKNKTRLLFASVGLSANPREHLTQYIDWLITENT